MVQAIKTNLEGFPKGSVCRSVGIPDDLRQRFIDRLESSSFRDEEIRERAVRQELSEMQRILNKLKAINH